MDELNIYVKALVVVILFLVCGLLLEKAFHPHNSMEWIATRFRKNIVTVVKVFLPWRKQRHIFSLELETALKAVTDPYREMAFEALVGNYADEATPCLCIAFVPRRGLSVTDLQAVTNLALLKCRDYLDVNGLPFRTFAVYQSIQQRIHVKVYYAEFSEDISAFDKCYQKAIAKAVGMNYGCLHDDALDMELNNVD